MKRLAQDPGLEQAACTLLGALSSWQGQAQDDFSKADFRLPSLHISHLSDIAASGGFSVQFPPKTKKDKPSLCRLVTSPSTVSMSPGFTKKYAKGETQNTILLPGAASLLA